MDRFTALFRTPLGRLLLFVTVLSLGAFFYHYSKPRQEQPAAAPAPEPATTATMTSFETSIQPPSRTQKATPTPSTERTKTQLPVTSISRTPMAIYVSREESVSNEFAAFGRLLRCQLVNTVDSSRIETPIIGIVEQDLWQNGRRIVPAGTEVHGSAQATNLRDRIASNNAWTLVFQDGRELKITGTALDYTTTSGQWAITDGSAGMRGYPIQSDPNREMKLLFAAMLQGAARGAQDQIQSLTPFGTVAATQTGSLQNALAAGLQSGTQQYTQLLTQQVGQDPFFVRVPAGTPFYLYITQTVDLAKASVGATLNAQQPPRVR